MLKRFDKTKVWAGIILLTYYLIWDLKFTIEYELGITFLFVVELIYTSLLVLYCLNILNKEKNNKIYKFALIILMILDGYYFLINYEYYGFTYFLKKLINVLFYYSMYRIKDHIDKFTLISGVIMVFLFNLMRIIDVLSYPDNAPILLYSISVTLIWWSEGGNLLKKGSIIFYPMTEEEVIDLKNEFIVAKTMLDENLINEEEYANKKKTILNKLWVNEEVIEEETKDKKDFKFLTLFKNKKVIIALIVLVLSLTAVFVPMYVKNTMQYQISFIEKIFELDNKEDIMNKYKDAEGEYGSLEMDGKFAGMDGYYEITFYSYNNVRNVIFHWNTYETEFDQTEFVNTLSEYLGDYSYNYSRRTYTWGTDTLIATYRQAGSITFSGR